jgi:hypothetical protein
MTAPRSLTTAERDQLVGAAITAPSMHNTQPWRFRFRGATIEVHRDPRYELPVEDPDRRMLLISTGAAVFNIRVAAARLGYDAAVSLHDASDSTLAAELQLGTLSHGGRAALADLYPYLARRRTNRAPFTDEAVPLAVRMALVAAAADEDAVLEWVVDSERRDWLLRLTAEANLQEAMDPDRASERRRWVGGERDRDGIPSASLGPKPRRPSAPVRDLAVDPEDRRRTTDSFSGEIALGVLATRYDTPRSWLVAGQALERLLLVATRHGVSVSLLNQAVEHAELRWLIRDPLTGWSEPQVVLRFGYGPDAPATPRRPAEEFIDD